MAIRTPKQHHRNVIPFVKLLHMIPDYMPAEYRFAGFRWSIGIRCAICDSTNIDDNATHETTLNRRRDSGMRVSEMTNSVTPPSFIG